MPWGVVGFLNVCTIRRVASSLPPLYHLGFRNGIIILRLSRFFLQGSTLLNIAGLAIGQVMD